jgi:copper transport protein
MTSSLKKLLVFAATGVFVALSAGSPASAHIGVASSNPSNGSEIAVAPEELSIRFNTDVALDTAAAQIRRIGDLDAPITDFARRDVPTDALTKISGTGNGADVSFTMPELSAGLYVADWSVDEIDGHINSSMIVFKVTEGAGGSTPVVVYAAAGVLVALVSFGTIIVLARKRAR